MRRKSPGGRGDGGGGSDSLGGTEAVASGVDPGDPIGLGTIAPDGLGLPAPGPVSGSQFDAMTVAATMTTATTRIETGPRDRRGGTPGGSAGGSDGGPAGGVWGVGIRIVGLSSAMSATVYGRGPKGSSRDPEPPRQALHARTDDAR